MAQRGGHCVASVFVLGHYVNHVVAVKCRVVTGDCTVIVVRGIACGKTRVKALMP